MTDPAASVLSASPPPPDATSSPAAEAPEPLTFEERQRVLAQLDDIYDRLDQNRAGKDGDGDRAHPVMRSVHKHPYLNDGAAARLKAVDGLIGVGKTTLCKRLIEALKEQEAEREHRLVVEPVLNEALDMFYANPDDMAERFQLLQCCLCTSSARLAVIESAYAENSGTVLLDRSPLGNLSFALVHYLSGRIPESGFILYKAALCSNGPLCLPTTIHLHTLPEIANQRITMRMRETDPTRVCESGIPLEYLRRLDAVMLLVSAYAAARGRSRVHFVDWSQFGSTASVLNRLQGCDGAQSTKVSMKSLRAVRRQSEMMELLGLRKRATQTPARNQEKKEEKEIWGEEQPGVRACVEVSAGV